MNVRALAVAAALQNIGVPYRWGGDDPARDGGLDCSGAVLHWMRQAGIDLPDTNAQGLREKLEPTTAPEPGDLAFYGANGRATHVVMVLTTGGKSIAGSNAGEQPGKGETPEAYAERMDKKRAGVRLEDHRTGGARYRGDLLGYGRLPVELAKGTP